MKTLQSGFIATIIPVSPFGRASERNFRVCSAKQCRQRSSYTAASAQGSSLEYFRSDILPPDRRGSGLPLYASPVLIFARSHNSLSSGEKQSHALGPVRNFVKISRKLVIIFLIAPFNVMVAIPAVILWAMRGTLSTASTPMDTGVVTLGVLLVGLGATGAYRCVSLFTDYGDGTPAPWDPPKNLVILGPYRHVRNPMIGSVFLVLLGEASFFASWPLFLWFAFFAAANLVYVPFFEEPQLARRFGDPYLLYKKNVCRWMPRWKPWKVSDEKS